MKKPNQSVRGFLISAVVAAALVLAAYLYLTSGPSGDDEAPDAPPTATTDAAADPGPPPQEPADQATDTTPDPAAESPQDTVTPPPATEPSGDDEAPDAPPTATTDAAADPGPPPQEPADQATDTTLDPAGETTAPETPVAVTPPPASEDPAAESPGQDTTGTGERAAPSADGDDELAPVDAPGPAAPLVFDIVRVDESGSVVLAGRAVPGSLVKILLNGVEQAESEAGPDGSFVAIFTIEGGAETLRLQLLEINEEGQERLSEDSVLVLVPPSESDDPDTTMAQADDDSVAPIALLETDEGLAVLEPQSPESSLTLDVLTFDRNGAVFVSGHGVPGSVVLIYIDNDFVAEVAVADSGSWSARLPAVTSGQHTLRVDQMNDSASVVNRLEMQFNADSNAASEAGVITTESQNDRYRTYTETELVVVRKGYTLWGISRSRYGLGRLYVTIFEANDHLIKDPDLIYPGQIFIIPR